MKKLGRNDLCWCGSGKKYKHCHEAFDEKLMEAADAGYQIPDHDMIKTPEQIEGIRESCKINVAVLDYVAEHIKAGVTTEEIDQWVYNETTRMGGIPAPLGYEGFPKTAIDWPVTPECLNWGPRFLYERYQTPIYITENGLSCHDVVSLDGKVHDPNRIDFLARYLGELKKAATAADIRGYFHWSLMDNFEWSKGYSERFGLIYVDYRTQQRIMKDSAYWYRDYIKNNGEI